MKSDMIFPLVMLSLLIVGAMIFKWYSNKSSSKADKYAGREEIQATSQFVNVADVTDNEILTTDNLVVSIFQLPPINDSLMTDREKVDYVTRLTSSLMTVRRPFKVLAVPRPFNIEPYIERLQQQKNTANDLQKNMLNEEIRFLNNKVISGNAVEKYYYMMIWDTPDDDYTRLRLDFAKAWSDAGVDVRLLDRSELLQLCNLINNPTENNNREIRTEVTYPVVNRS